MGASGVAHIARQLGIKPPLSARRIFAAARRGDATAQQVVRTEAQRIAFTLAAVLSAQPNVSEPIGFDVLPDGRVIQTDRRGGVRLHDPVSGSTTVIAQIPVYMHSEDGMYGPEVDNDFERNRWVYLYYAPPTVTIDGQEFTTPPNTAAPTLSPTTDTWTKCPNPDGVCWRGYFQLSRFKLVEQPTPHLDIASEQKILQVPVDRGACCHVAGDIDFDSDNNLWLVTGDDTPAGGGDSGGFGPFNDLKTNERQTVRTLNATGGTFTLTFDGQTTAPIPFNATAAQTQAALEGLGNIEPGDVVVIGNPLNTANQTVRFGGQYTQVNLAQMTSDASGLTGTNPTAPVNTTREGDWFQPPFVDARRSSLNTNDLRGKVLRIEVERDGSYDIPRGNLFRESRDRDDKTRPEIYAMGFRNPFRITLDEDDVAYVTDYSPDSRVPQVFRGPAGTGRVEIVRRPANYGWPVCYSDELPYFRWNFNTETPLDAIPQPYECDNPSRGPENTSRWNTGLTHGPAITNPDVWYSYNDNQTPPTGPLGTPCPANYAQDPPGTCPQLFPEFGPGGGVGEFLGFGDVLREPLLVAIFDLSFERHDAVRDCHLDLARVDLAALPELLAHVLANPFIGSHVALRSPSGEPSDRDPGEMARGPVVVTGLLPGRRRRGEPRYPALGRAVAPRAEGLTGGGPVEIAGTLAIAPLRLPAEISAVPVEAVTVRRLRVKLRRAAGQLRPPLALERAGRRTGAQSLRITFVILAPVSPRALSRPPRLLAPVESPSLVVAPSELTSAEALALAIFVVDHQECLLSVIRTSRKTATSMPVTSFKLQVFKLQARAIDELTL